MSAADCHFHIFDPARFAYKSGVVYTPHPSQAGTADQLLAVFDAHGITHGLAVGAAPYGDDNRCLLDGIARSQGRLKGIALVDHDVSDAEITRLSDGGVVGVRINLHNHGLGPLLDARAPARGGGHRHGRSRRGVRRARRALPRHDRLRRAGARPARRRGSRRGQGGTDRDRGADDRRLADGPLGIRHPAPGAAPRARGYRRSRAGSLR